MPHETAQTNLDVASIQQITDRWQAICDKAWAAYHKGFSEPTPYVPDPSHPEYPARPSKPRPQSYKDSDRDPYQEPLTGSGVRLDDGKWYPTSDSPSPPGSPVDPPFDLQSFLDFPPPDSDDALLYRRY